MDITKNLPRDTFLYLFSAVALIVSAISFGTLLFQYINIYFPDVLADYYWSKNMFYGAIRSALAALIVIFPVYVWISLFLHKDIKSFPEKSELKIRKWLLYFTVFSAAVVIIGDLVVLMQTYLNGELTVRFLLKVASVFFIAGAIFYHYFLQLRVPKKAGVTDKFFPMIVVFTVGAAVVFGFFVAGSPQSRRLERLDEKRANDLSMIQNEVVSYWQRKLKLPAFLSELSGLPDASVPSDPVTGKPYEYAVKGNLKFELCAVFDTVNNGESQFGSPAVKSAPVYDRAGMNAFYDWKHDSGRVCFDRKIDPELYKPIK